jgi:hypothetical protein
MDRIRAALLRCIKDQVAAKIRFRSRRRSQPVGFIRMQHMERRTISIGINRNRRNPQFSASPHNAQSNLAAVSNQNFADGQRKLRTLEAAKEAERQRNKAEKQQTKLRAANKAKSS